MSEQLAPLKTHLGPDLFIEFSQTLAMAFYEIFPNIRPNHITNKWYSTGFTGDLVACLNRDELKLSDQMLAKIQSVMPACIQEMIRAGKLTDEFMTSIGIPLGPTGDLDDKAMKSQRVVLMTHAVIRAATMARVKAAKEAAALKAKKKREGREKGTGSSTSTHCQGVRTKKKGHSSSQGKCEKRVQDDGATGRKG